MRHAATEFPSPGLSLSAIPAYGRQYLDPKGFEDLWKDWKDGKDFKIVPEGPYFSIRDVPSLWGMNYRTITFYRSSTSMDSISLILREPRT